MQLVTVPQETSVGELLGESIDVAVRSPVFQALPVAVRKTQNDVVTQSTEASWSVVTAASSVRLGTPETTPANVHVLPAAPTSLQKVAVTQSAAYTTVGEGSDVLADQVLPPSVE